MNSIMNFIRGAWALVEGYSVTMKQFFSKGSTVPYPDARPFISKRWRGVHGLFFNDARTEELCVSCHLCASVCPAVCITMEGSSDDDGKKTLHRFDVDLGRCIYCGYCEEICPVDAIRLTSSFDYTVRSREDFVLKKEDLLAVGTSAMKGGELGALGVRRASGDELSHRTNRNRTAKFVARHGKRIEEKETEQ